MEAAAAVRATGKAALWRNAQKKAASQEFRKCAIMQGALSRLAADVTARESAANLCA